MKTTLKKVIRVVIFFIVLIPFGNPLVAQNKFEGKIKFKIQDESGNISFMTYYSQNGKTRMDMADKSGKLYLIETGKTLYMVMPIQKMYTASPMDKINQMNADSLSDNSLSADKNSGGEAGPGFSMSKFMTGRTRTILGYKCRELVLPDEDGSSMHIWGTSALGNVVLVGNSSMNPFSFISQFTKMSSFFPLLTEVLDRNGKLISKKEVVEISKSKLDNSLFVVPSGYKRMGAFN